MSPQRIYGRLGGTTKPHVFRDRGQYVCRNRDTTGYGYDVCGACADWNHRLTSTRVTTNNEWRGVHFARNDRSTLTLNLGAPVAQE